jgi:hypothetical protein
VLEPKTAAADVASQHKSGDWWPVLVHDCVLAGAGEVAKAARSECAASASGSKPTAADRRLTIAVIAHR